MDLNVLIQRMIRAARLDRHLYEEVEANEQAFGQAIAVVVIASVAAGIGTAAQGGLLGLVIGAIGALISWFIWAYLTYWIGTRVLPESETHADPGQMLRTIGFSSSPGVIRIVGIVPALAQLAYVVGGLWMLVAMVVAVRQALDFESTPRAVGVVAIGWAIQAVILALLFSVLPGPGGGAAS
ncbi:MAG: YIP1 family protein [Candidatus Bipolaricaulia bacterium]